MNIPCAGPVKLTVGAEGLTDAEWPLPPHASSNPSELKIKHRALIASQLQPILWLQAPDRDPEDCSDMLGNLISWPSLIVRDWAVHTAQKPSTGLNTANSA